MGIIQETFMIGNLEFTKRFELGKQAEVKFEQYLTKQNIQFRREKVNQQWEPDYIKRHTPDYYLPQKKTFVEFKSTHNLREDLIDVYYQWFNLYGNPHEYMFYIAVHTKDMDHVAFYDLMCLNTDLPTWKISGEWSDGKKYYTIPQETECLTWRL